MEYKNFFLMCESCEKLFDDYGTYLKCPICGDIIIYDEEAEDED